MTLPLSSVNVHSEEIQLPRIQSIQIFRNDDLGSLLLLECNTVQALGGPSCLAGHNDCIGKQHVDAIFNCIGSELCRGVSPGDDTRGDALSAAHDEEVQAAVVCPHQGHDIQQANGSEGWQQAKNKNGASQNDCPGPA